MTFPKSENSDEKAKAVLVVEDEADDIELVKIAAREAGSPFSFFFVNDGEQALAYLEGAGPYADRGTHPFPDLVVLDLKMPRQDGLEVLKHIRTKAHLERLQIVVWTSWEDLDAPDRVRRAGANLFLRKPDQTGGWINFIGMIALALKGRSLSTSHA
jgi:CheY-like chemotaxis protein